MESIGQHTSRAKALLRMLSAEGWTRDDIDNKAFRDFTDLIQAARDTGTFQTRCGRRCAVSE